MLCQIYQQVDSISQKFLCVVFSSGTNAALVRHVLQYAERNLDHEDVLHVFHALSFHSSL